MNGGDDGTDADRRGGHHRRLAGGDGRLDKVRLDGEADQFKGYFQSKSHQINEGLYI